MDQRPRGRGRSGLSRRLGLYLFGVALGLVLVGFLLSLRTLTATPTRPGDGGAPAAPGP